MRLEHIDRRVLGALRFLDPATRLPIAGPLLIDAPGGRLMRNRMGDYVIFDAPGLADHTAEFLQPPAAPAIGSVPLELTVSDPEGQYLPQRVVIALPRNRDAGADDAIFRPIETPLYLAPAGRTASGCALVRAAVVRSGTTQALAGALIRVLNRNDNDTVLARGLSDARGEALVAVPGIQITNWNQEPGEGPVTTPQIAVTIEVIFDPVAQGAPNPRALEDRSADLLTGEQDAELASGQTLVITLSVNVP